MGILEGKVAIVTGASSGIGRASAKLFAAEGAKLVITARRRRELDALAEEIAEAGGEAAVMIGDVREEALAEALVETALSRFGGLDIGFNNAGGLGETGPIDEMALETWRETIETNLTSAFLGARHQVPAMKRRGGGSLIFTSSFVGHSAGMPGLSAYAAAKAGMVGMVRSLAAELGPQAIRANALVPGGVDTPSNHANAPGAGPEVRAFVEGLHALKRMAKPEEIARAALFLASEASSFVTGSAFEADGGVAISRV
jgi:NAD(P)-dependent dehydrogenase (short-subunit alcohol dehydrogenase family)